MDLEHREPQTSVPAGMPLDNERQTNIQWAVCWAIAAALLIAGWFLCEFLDSINATSPHSRFLNVTYYIFGAYDRILLLPLAIVAGLMYALWHRSVAAGATAYNSRDGSLRRLSLVDSSF